jgi:ribosome-binding factor A
VSDRTRRLDHLLREEVSAILRREISDPRIGFVTITSVEVSNDLRHATVWASVIGDADERRASLRALERAMPYVRHHLGALRLRRIPELKVREDDSFQRGTRVMELLDRIGAEEGTGPPDLEELVRDSIAPTLPTPGPVVPPADEGAEPATPLQAAPQRRARPDPRAIRKARERRGR